MAYRLEAHPLGTGSWYAWGLLADLGLYWVGRIRKEGIELALASD